MEELIMCVMLPNNTTAKDAEKTLLIQVHRNMACAKNQPITISHFACALLISPNL